MSERRYTVADPPSCDFLKKSKNGEFSAIMDYTGESERTDDPLVKEFFLATSRDEMRHFDRINDLMEKLGCKD